MVRFLLTGQIRAVEQDCETLQADDADDANAAQKNVSGGMNDVVCSW